MAVNDMYGVVMNYELENITIEESSATTPELAIEEIQSGKSLFKLFGSIKKALQGCVTKSKIINNLAATITGNVLDATQGKVLDDKIGVINTNLTTITAACTLESGFTANRNKCIKNHKTITIEISGSWATPQASGTKFATVPNNYRPNFTDQIRVKTGGGTPGIIYIYSDGNMYFYSDNGGTYPMVDNYIITFVNI